MKHERTVVSRSCAVVVILGMLILSPRAAHAALNTDTPRPAVAASTKEADALVAEMRLDCSTMTKTVFEYAVAHGYCVVADDTSIQDTRWGNCGSSWLYIDSKGGGNAGISWGAFSIQGVIAYRDLVVSWLNYSQGNSGWFTDKNYTFSNPYGQSRSFFTRTGNTIATLSGSVRLVWGGTCVVLNPSDSAYI